MNWSIAAPAVTAAFVASTVEVVEAFTIVLAVATLRGWCPAALGTTAGLAPYWQPSCCCWGRFSTVSQFILCSWR